MSLRLNGMEVFLHEMDTAIAYGDISDYSEYVDLFVEKHGYSEKTKSNLKANENARERFDNRVVVLQLQGGRRMNLLCRLGLHKWEFIDHMDNVRRCQRCGLTQRNMAITIRESIESPCWCDVISTRPK